MSVSYKSSHLSPMIIPLSRTVNPVQAYPELHLALRPFDLAPFSITLCCLFVISSLEKSDHCSSACSLHSSLVLFYSPLARLTLPNYGVSSCQAGSRIVFDFCHMAAESLCFFGFCFPDSSSSHSRMVRVEIPSASSGMWTVEPGWWWTPSGFVIILRALSRQEKRRGISQHPRLRHPPLRRDQGSIHRPAPAPQPEQNLRQSTGQLANALPSQSEPRSERSNGIRLPNKSP